MDYCLVLFLLSNWWSAAALEGSSFFPDGFSGADFSQYTVRYVSNSSSGQDTEACLQSQPLPLPLPQGYEGCMTVESYTAAVPGVVPCRSIGYSLLEECNLLDYRDCVANVTTNLLILVYPGVYNYGANYSVTVNNYSNLVIRRLPVCEQDGEAELSCTRFIDTLYNNLFIRYSNNLAIDGIVFSRCGSKSPGAAMSNVHNATITNCIFR